MTLNVEYGAIVCYVLGALTPIESQEEVPLKLREECVFEWVSGKYRQVCGSVDVAG